MKLFSRVGEGCVSKSFSLFLIVILTTTSLVIAKPVFAQTPTPTSVPIPTPSVPTFTVQPVGPPYTVPTTYSLNQSSGQVVPQIGYINEYSYVEITIKNQAFTPSNAANGLTTSFYYNIQIKDHSESDNWTDIYYVDVGYPTQSTDSDYTNISIPIYSGQQVGIQIPTGTQTDIQVEAMIGYIGRVYNPNATNLLDMYPWTFIGQTSGWSSTRTVTIPASTPLSTTSAPNSTSTPTATSTPNQTASSTPQNPISVYAILIGALVVLIVAFVIVMALLVRVKRR